MTTRKLSAGPANMTGWSEQELSSWLDERLPSEQMAALEEQLRTDRSLQSQIAELMQIRDQGGHSAGEIWQRLQLTCPSRSDLLEHLHHKLDPDHSDFINFHIETAGCSRCQANLRDLQDTAHRSPASAEQRKRLHGLPSQFAQSRDDFRVT